MVGNEKYHFGKENATILGDLNLTGSSDKPGKELKRLVNAKKYILRVPLGPRLLLMTSWRPLAALIFMAKALNLLRTSALELTNWTDDIFYVFYEAAGI